MLYTTVTNYNQNQLLIILACLILSILSQSIITKAYSKYSKISASCNITGAEIALKFLNNQGIYDINVVPVHGMLSDHYDPTNKTIRLSKDVYYGTSIASISIACHEAGHAIQHSEGYAMLVVRNKLIPLVNVANRFSWILIFIGLLLGSFNLLMTGLVLFGIIALFQFITLPVEFNASKRALNYLNQTVLVDSEYAGAKKVLTSAAFTYVAALLVSILQILRFAMMFTNRRR